MAGLTRATQKVFAQNAGPNDITQFGSLANNTLTYSNDPATIQALSQFLSGWFSAVLGVNSPAIEDVNALFFLAFRQLAYLFTRGVPEWDSATTYNTNDVARSGAVLYVSLVDSNTGNAVTDTTKWSKLSQTANITTKTSNFVVTASNDVILCDGSAGGFNVTLPAATGSGKIYNIKKIDTTGNPITFVFNGSDTLDGDSAQSLDQPYIGVTIVDGGSGKWYIL